MECIRILLVFSAKAGCKRSFREHLKLLAFSFPRSSEFPSFLSTGRSKNQQQLFSLQLRFLSLHSTSSLWNSHFKSSCLLALYSKTEVSKCVQLFNIWRSGVLKVWNGLYFLFFPHWVSVSHPQLPFTFLPFIIFVWPQVSSVGKSELYMTRLKKFWLLCCYCASYPSVLRNAAFLGGYC